MDKPDLTKHIEYEKQISFAAGYELGKMEGFAKGVRIEVHSVLPEPENFEELTDKLVKVVRAKLGCSN